MSKLSETFRKRLEASLTAWGDQTALAEKTGLSYQTVRRWMRGENVPDLDQIELAARALGKDPIDLLFPGELPRAPEPGSRDVVFGFTELFAEIAKTEQGRKMLAEAVLAVLGNVRAARGSEISRPKEK